MDNRTDRQYRVEAALIKAAGQSLADWVADRRRPSVRPPASWRTISLELSQLTGIAVSYEALREWFAEADTPAVTP
jgi:hypothetical protein